MREESIVRWKENRFFINSDLGSDSWFINLQTFITNLMRLKLSLYGFVMMYQRLQTISSSISPQISKNKWIVGRQEVESWRWDLADTQKEKRQRPGLTSGWCMGPKVVSWQSLVHMHRFPIHKDWWMNLGIEGDVVSCLYEIVFLESWHVDTFQIPKKRERPGQG